MRCEVSTDLRAWSNVIPDGPPVPESKGIAVSQSFTVPDVRVRMFVRMVVDYEHP